ncbi:MAG: histidinol-phosphate transaminase [Dissulfurimicrobium hydrothermale]|uniref:histidinol-phosphate transaminase n=1 Tax=Dissulfurimicrobium hydrothermale TaxID=1750598 RepID=UPI003C708070
MTDKRCTDGVCIPGYIKELVPYTPGKPIEELEREYGIKDAIKLASNENPLGPSPKALKAIEEAIGRLHRYPDGSSYYLKNRLAERFGVSPAQIVLGNGSNELIEFLVRVFVRSGCEVISSAPSFLVYTKVVQAAGGKNVIVPLRDGRHDLGAIRAAVTPETRVIFLDNPNNPTGSVIYRSELDAFLHALPNEVLVVMDEAYMEFVQGGVTPSGLEYLERGDGRVVTLRTFSKAYGLAGLRVGYGIMDPVLAGYIERVRQPFNINSLAQAGALAALDDKEHFNNTLKITLDGRSFLAERLAGLGCRVFPSHTNFLLVDVHRDAKMVYEAMLRQGVIIRAMTAYGFPDHIRITVGLPYENERCISALKLVLTD